jgi:hypothetical protein
MKIELIPGIARNKASTTKRKDEIREIKRNIRKIRIIRNTENTVLDGIKEIPIIKKSNTFQPFLESMAESMGSDSIDLTV